MASFPNAFGPWEVMKGLGQGHFASVFNVRRPLAGNSGEYQIGALKALHPGSSPDKRLTMNNEVLRLSGLEHPNLSHFIDSGTLGDGTIWFVMKFIPGTALLDVVKHKGALSEGNWLALAKELLDCLVYLRKKDILHLDIKPDNVIQSESGKFHLVDFGLSSKTFADGVGYINTKWSSPEQMKVVQADETSASDVFSIALTLAFALTGRHPWLPSLDMDYGQRLLSQSADLSGMPEKYRHWIIPALAKDPKNRPSAQELLHELDVISGGEEFVKPEGSEIRTWLELEAQLGIAFVSSLEFECQVNTNNKGSWIFELHQSLDEGKYLILRSADNPPSSISPSNLKNIGKLGWRISDLNSNERVVRLDNFDESNFDAIKLIIATLRSGFSISIENIQAVSFF